MGWQSQLSMWPDSKVLKTQQVFLFTLHQIHLTSIWCCFFWDYSSLKTKGLQSFKILGTTKPIT